MDVAHSPTTGVMPVLRLLGAQFAIGAAAVFARFALAGAGPVAVSALRLGIAAFVALLIVRGFAPIGRRKELAFACAGVVLGAHFAAWIASLLYTSVAASTLLVTTTPIWTELYDTVRERRTPTAPYLAALALALSGVAAIAFGHAAAPPPVPGHALLGDALALCGSLAIGAYLIIVRGAGTDGRGRLGTRQIIARTYSWAALTLVVLSLFVRQGPPALGDAAAWGGILAMALVSQLLGHTALNAALRDFSPSTIAMTTLLEPIVAAVLAAWIFRETLSWQSACGGVLVLAAIALNLSRGGTAPRPPPGPDSRAQEKSGAHRL